MTSWYSGVLPANNTPTNRTFTLNALTIDPIITTYLPTAINYVDDYTIVVIFTNTVSNVNDQTILQQILDINFNDATDGSVDYNQSRSVYVTSGAPTVNHDSSLDFDIGSFWVITSSNITYFCYNNILGAAVWINSPPMSLSGVGTGSVGDIPPYNGAILQYSNVSNLWVAQPSQYQTLSTGSLNMFKAGVSDPALSSLVGNLKTYNFSNGSVQELFFDVVIPHNYAEGTDITAVIHFLPTTTNTGNVVFGIEYNWANISSVISASTSIENTSAVSGIVNTHLLSTFSAISGTGFLINSVLNCRVYRDGTNVADTYLDPISLLSVDFKFQQIGNGSGQMLIK